MSGHQQPHVHSADVVLVGGGLANILIALRLAALRPQLRLVVLERGAELGGNHTWSFHTTDVTAAQLAWLRPLLIASWSAQEVRFPAHARLLATGYNSISSDRLAEVAMAALGPAVRLNTVAASVRPDGVDLVNGETIEAACVIDGRGALGEQPLALGYQKFLGFEVETEEPHGQAHPIIMDATVEQADGYRFVYTLPFTATRMLIEDTYYSDNATIDHLALEANISAYAARRGWRIAGVVRQEAGVLPITLAGDIDRHWKTMGQDVARSGLRAWLFHPTTGYSLPYAARIAEEIAALPQITSRTVAKAVETASRAAWSDQALFRLVNRMLFLSARPDERVRVLERFYTLPEPLIQRFYAARLTLRDQARILIGRPPLPILRAARSIDPRGAWAFAARQKPAELG